MTNLTLDALRVPVADADAATTFYTDVFGAAVTTDAACTVDLHGRATIELLVSEAPPATRFGRLVVTYVLEQPSEVRAVMDAAISHGAQILKPARKALFGSFSGSFVSPDGLIWKLASDKGKDTAPPALAPRPTEVTIILGVREPKESRKFYADLGMEVDRDYGSKYIDFRPAAGAIRLCLMQSPVLAKDVGVADSSQPPGVTLVHSADEREAAPGVARELADPDGFGWVIEAT